MRVFRLRRLAVAVLTAAAFGVAGCALRPGDVTYLVNSPDARPEVVATDAGPVRGVATPRGRAFLAIPYAAPPVGPLRWRPPQPPSPWIETRDATKGGANCPQPGVPGSGRQSEDCLTLNVYAPADAHPGDRLPVMVWIYGGGYVFGYTSQYDLSRLAQRQHVVTVTMNYRLGALGFLAHPALAAEGEGSGDFAMLDQQAALRWVQANVAGFGGDPSNVTLFGESAGAWSACEQLASPGARGLFARVIIESGACSSPESAIAEATAEQGGLALAADLGCGDPATAAACLRAVPASRVIKAKAHRRGLLGKDSWAPTFGTATLPLSPRAAFEQGTFPAVSVIDGTNHDEARLFLDLNRFKGGLYSEASYEKIIRDFFLERTPQVLAEYADEARRSYADAYVDVVDDSTFACPSVTTDRLLATKSPVYGYEFDDPHAVTSLPRAPFTPPLGAYHSSEIAYVFQTPWVLADPARFDPAQRALSDRMQQRWANFARTGAPQADDGGSWPIERAGARLEMRPEGDRPTSDYAVRHRCAFWNALGY